MIDELQRFVLVANEGNLTKAAQKIFITQSALTQSVHRLEKEIGAKLFVQKGRYLQLTADGIALKALGVKILDLWEKAKDSQVRGSMKPTLTIGMFDNAAQRLASFVQKNTPSQKFSLEFMIDNSSRLLSNLQLGVIDIAIIVKGTHPYPKEILCLKTFEEELIPVSCQLFSGPMQKIPFILYNKGSNTREQIDMIFINKGIRPKVYAESTSPTFMKELAILNCGVALLPENLVQQELKQGILTRQTLPVKWKRQYGIFVQKNNNLEYINLFVNEIVQILQAY